MIIDGKKIAKKILEDLKEKVSKEGKKPGLAFIVAGEDPASHIYVKKKKEACALLGIYSEVATFPKTLKEEELLSTIDSLNKNPAIDGILVQMPLPEQINPKKAIEALAPKKDVDGFHPLNMGRLLLGDAKGIIPCTPQGIVMLLKESGLDPTGKHAVIVGRSNIVGKPLAALLMQKQKGCNATVTIAHSQSENLKKITLSADILIAAIGKPQYITKEMVKKGAIVIDVGISRERDGIVGDVDFKEVSKIASYITPVPGGVGPMTIAMLMKNTWESFCRRKNEKNRIF